MSAIKSGDLCKIHNVRFYNLRPRSINYLAYNYKTNKLAVSRLVFSVFINGDGTKLHFKKHRKPI